MDFYIETERLILRHMLPTDIDGMFEMDSNLLVHKYLGKKPVTSIDESKNIIEGIINQYEERGIGRWAVVEKSTGEFIGWSGLRRYIQDETFNGFSGFIDIGYRLIPRYWGKGYATESSLASLHYAFNTMKLNTVYGITEIGNEASHNVLLKIGLKYIEDFTWEKEQTILRWYELKKDDYEKTMS